MMRAALAADDGAPVLGTWSQFDSADAIEVLASGGLNFTIIDTEHTAFGMARAQDLLRAATAAGLPAAVRVPELERVQVAKARDAGFDAIVAPGIRSAADVRRLCEWMHFPGSGTRGACPCIRQSGQTTANWAEFADASDRAALPLPLIETPEALDDLDGILAVAGLRYAVLGPFDLSVALGYRGETNCTQMREVLAELVRACVAASVAPILPLFAPSRAALCDSVDLWRRAGVRHFTLGTDKMLLSSAVRDLTAHQ